MQESQKHLKVTFFVFSKLLKKSFINVELHQSLADAQLRASALGWQIVKTEQI
jgi:hypothetical protein